MSNDLQEAKERLLAASAAYQPFGYVQRRPLRSLGAAFAAGFVTGRSGGAGTTVALAPVLLHTLMLAEKLGFFPGGR